MAVQQETLIGDEDLDALMAELEVETASMVAPPPAIKAAAPLISGDGDGLDDPDLNDGAQALEAVAIAGGQASAEQVAQISDDLAGLDEDPTVFAPTTPASAEPVVELGPTDPRDNVEDEMAALEAELAAGAATAPAAPAPAPAAPSMAEKIAAKAAALAKEFPSDVPKPATEKKNPIISEASVIADLDAELAGTAPATPVTPPENPNPPPKPAVTAGTGALAGLGYEIDIDQFRRDISVTENNLDNCMMEQAGLIAWYIAQHAMAEAQAARTKVQVEMGEAKLYAQHREHAVAKVAVDPAFKVTEKVVENAVRMDPKYGAIQNRLIEADTRAAIWKGCVEGLKQRRDMIIQLGADRREDGKGAVRIMAKEQSHADLKAAAVAAARR